MFKWLEDQILRWLQRRCTHPDKMISSDILEGCRDGLIVSVCNRCGAVKVIMGVNDFYNADLLVKWRLPDPNLWRG